MRRDFFHHCKKVKPKKDSFVSMIEGNGRYFDMVLTTDTDINVISMQIMNTDDLPFQLNSSTESA